ncbi:MAG: exo-alpha-sialidase [Kiritimatiellaeota bacterium]|nr:exo-alpha-sialidase [Kiritimatiellota bacterium]
MSQHHLSQPLRDRLEDLARALIDQQAARVLVRPNRDASGFWFGGGNLSRGPDGRIWLAGRYRNYGDSRTGLAVGERGLECVLFESRDSGESFSRVRTWTKADLSVLGEQVLSIEGTALHFTPDGGCEFFISTEKSHAYPERVRQFQKPGTGIWSIDVMSGDTPETLDVHTLRPVVAENPEAPDYLHVKDPVVFDLDNGDTGLIFCSHPFCWSSSNTGLAVRTAGTDEFAVRSWQLIGRGPAWDVAVTRVTNRLPIPRLGRFADGPGTSLYFYDGAECVRQHEQSASGVLRARGYSCEEIGGVLFGFDAQFPRVERLSRLQPWFVSPQGTGCSRYVDTLVTEAGIRAVWQQSQSDLSQPLVTHFLPMTEVERILT